LAKRSCHKDKDASFLYNPDRAKLGREVPATETKYRTGNYISMGEGCMLRKAQDTKMSLNYRKPDAYDPGTGSYLDDLDWEADFQIYEWRRSGSMDLKVLALHRDGFRCRKCGTTVTWETSEADHIQPVSQFASFAESHSLNNVQILCDTCHEEKTYAK
jgi:hypothetical protein